MDTVFADDRCDVGKPAPHSRSVCGGLKKEEEEESTGDGDVASALSSVWLQIKHSKLCWPFRLGRQ